MNQDLGFVKKASFLSRRASLLPQAYEHAPEPPRQIVPEQPPYPDCAGAPSPDLAYLADSCASLEDRTNDFSMKLFTLEGGVRSLEQGIKGIQIDLADVIKASGGASASHFATLETSMNLLRVNVEQLSREVNSRCKQTDDKAAAVCQSAEKAFYGKLEELARDLGERLCLSLIHI